MRNFLIALTRMTAIHIISNSDFRCSGYTEDGMKTSKFMEYENRYNVYKNRKKNKPDDENPGK